VESNASRFGFKGSEDLGNGLKALFQIEFAIETADGLSTTAGDETINNRLGWAGLSGNWGTAAIGRQWTPYYNAVNKSDIFQMASMNPTLGGTLAAVAGATGDTFDDTTGRVGDAVAYISPDFSGFNAAVALVMASESDLPNLNNENIDLYNIALNYNNGPLSIGVSGMKFMGDNDKASYADFSELDDWLYGAAAKYTFADMIGIIGQYETYDGDQWSASLVLEYYFGNNTLRGLFNRFDTDDTGPDDEYYSWGVELQHAFSKRTRIYASYMDKDLWSFSGSAAAGNLNAEDGGKFGIGVRHDF
jgi:predicted porin